LRHHAFPIKEKLNKPNPALTMAADNNPHEWRTGGFANEANE